MNVNPWLQAMRPRTLPLGLASALLGTVVAADAGVWSAAVALFSVLTAVSLQVLSNLANDYGDGVSGADGADRLGPVRMVGSGMIAATTMRRGLWVAALLAASSGCCLLLLAVGHQSTAVGVCLLAVLGLSAVAAAVLYTVGRRPYGYRGWGDVAVLLFFGWVGVLGTAYLHSGSLNAAAWAAATALGLLCAAVLNLNNMRDRENDAAVGKRTLAVRLGAARALHYHGCLLVAAGLCWLAYVAANRPVGPALVLLLLAVLLLGRHAWMLWRQPQPLRFNMELKYLSLSILALVLSVAVF